RVDGLDRLGDRIEEARLPVGAEVELAEPVLAVELAARDAIEVLLELGGVAIRDELAEAVLEERDDGERDPLGDERLPLLADVGAVEDRLNGRGVRRRAADAELLEFLHERGLGVAGRGLRRVPLRLDLADGEALADLDLREGAL